MLRQGIFLFVVFVTLLLPKVGLATIITTNGTGGGDWSDPNTWSPVGVPSTSSCVDTIKILTTDFVALTSTSDLSSCPPIVFIVAGQLDFPNNGPQLKLPLDSYIDVPSGGIVSAPGHDNSNKISIGGAQIWTSNQPDIAGPTSYGVTPLPIELVNFEAHIDSNHIDLEWVTASEINNDFFTVERSVDAKTWEVVVTSLGAGNSNQAISYYETDYFPHEGVSYYRLKQTDFNGAFSYSNIVPVKFEIISGIEPFINVFPTLANAGETINVEFKNIFESEILVVLRDISGREFYSKMHINIEDGRLIGVPINVDIPKGIYLITASSENQMYSQKIVIK